MPSAKRAEIAKRFILERLSVLAPVHETTVFLLLGFFAGEDIYDTISKESVFDKELVVVKQFFVAQDKEEETHPLSLADATWNEGSAHNIHEIFKHPCHMQCCNIPLMFL